MPPIPLISLSISSKTAFSPPLLILKSQGMPQPRPVRIPFHSALQHLFLGSCVDFGYFLQQRERDNGQAIISPLIVYCQLSKPASGI
jgi:hypothetical protein